MKLRYFLAAATCLALPAAAAHAQPVTGPYISVGGGTSISNPVNFAYTSEDYEGIYANSGKYQSRPSYAAVAGVGYGFGNGFRVELGGNFYRNTFHAADVNTELSNDFGDNHYRIYGGQNTYGPMFNAYYDINVGLPIFPYVGAGVGYQWVKLNSSISDQSPVGDLFGFRDRISGTQGSFAYQLIGGVAYPLPFLPQLSLTLEYRFMQITASRNYNATFIDDDGFSGSDGQVKLGQQSSNSFFLGVRYQIFPPPVVPVPVPVAAPAPAPAKTYLVFFDWDKYNLTPRATQIIAQAASDSHTQQVTTLNVSGYTDTSGTAQYNMGLSQRRAKAVAAKLVADGVPQSEISIHAFGETHLLVPTGPGVREPQNRRVEIVLN